MIDRIVLDPANTNISSLGQMEGYSHLGSMTVVSPYVSDELIEELYYLIQSKEVKFGISACPVPGFSLRVLAKRTQVIEDVFQECQNYLRKKWFDMQAVSLRKY